MDDTNQAAAREPTSQENASREEIPLACDVGAIDSSTRTTHLTRAGHLLRDVALECQETADGYLFRFRADDYSQVVEFIGNERLCCPFLHFVLEIPPSKGTLWLHIHGNEQARALLRAELNLP